jgi:hypothetical protein
MTSKVAAAALERSAKCADCGTDLEMVTRLAVVGLAGPPIAPFCFSCSGKRAPESAEWPVAPCEQCTRPVRRPPGQPGRVVCSRECHRKVRVADRREKRWHGIAVAATCEGCLEPMARTRPDQRTHGPACRDRKRRRNAASPVASTRQPVMSPCVCDGSLVAREEDGELVCFTCGKPKTPPRLPDGFTSPQREPTWHARAAA